MMVIDRPLPDALQYKPAKREVDEAVQKAKLALLHDIKRSVYIYRVDCGGCNGCEIEIFSTITPVFDAERFGIKNTPSPRHADILVYTGAVTRAMRMPALRAYDGAPDPKLVVSYGACGCTGGVFHDNYCTWGGTDKIIPVDVYIPGCPPTPAQPSRWSIPALRNLPLRRRISTPPAMPTTRRRSSLPSAATPTRKRCWYSAPVPSASVRASSLTTALSTRSGR